ncbi:hypothetical protein A2U01_0000325 [Trifolium medium]|uniref:Reverse transcriptase domain-containing protein n=1 Tax=Trifolium medium TaxID=97028 RepID=A0A392LX89_9FABA|nr:hypothetical protein [Trifolium medium]
MGKIMISNKMELLLANKSIINAQGIIEDVLVQVEDLTFPVDFIIIDIDLADERDIILGRSFLATSKACIDIKKGELKIEMNEEVRTFKVYGKTTSRCYKVDIREKDLEDAPPTPSPEIEEEIDEEELSELEELSESEDYTPDELLGREMDELDCRLHNMKEYDVRTLKACREQGKEWIERLTIEINSRGPAAKSSQEEKERLWHSKVFDL